MHSAPVLQIVGNSESHRLEDGSRVVRYRKIKPSSETAETGAYPLLYPYGPRHKPFDLATYLQATSGEGEGAQVVGSQLRVNKLTWAEHSKRRLYTDNILHGGGALFQQWMLRTVTHIENMRLQFLEKQQQSRIVEERELIQAADPDVEEFNVGRLYLPDNVTNTPAYWKARLLDVQAIVYRRHIPSLFITLTMNPWREEMRRMGLDTENRSAFQPQGDRPRVFDRPDLVARVYNQQANAFMKDLKDNSFEYFGRHCVGITGKLEFQARNTPHHHILLFLEGGLLDDMDEIDNIISAELPTEEEDPELRELVLRYNKHQCSPYCKRTGRCVCVSRSGRGPPKMEFV